MARHDRTTGAEGTKAQQLRRIAEAFEIKRGGGKHRVEGKSDAGKGGDGKGGKK